MYRYVTACMTFIKQAILIKLSDKGIKEMFCDTERNDRFEKGKIQTANKEDHRFCGGCGYGGVHNRTKRNDRQY